MSSVNCQGLRDFKKRYDVLEYLHNSDASIFCLQDTHWLSKDINLIKQTWNGECLIHGISTYNDDLGKIISVDLKLSSLYVKIINIYAPNNDSPDFLKFVTEIINSNEQPYTILCGDFNVALKPEIDTYNYKKINNPKTNTTDDVQL